MSGLSTLDNLNASLDAAFAERDAAQDAMNRAHAEYMAAMRRLETAMAQIATELAALARHTDTRHVVAKVEEAMDRALRRKAANAGGAAAR
jgi:DNA-binding transcriptional MocR family regulator